MSSGDETAVSSDYGNDTDVRDATSWTVFLRTASRLRLIQLATAVVTMGAVSQAIDGPFFSSWWFWVGVSTAFSTTLLEPHFTAPRSAATNAAGAIAIYFTATHDLVEFAWWVFLALAVLVLLVATLVMLESFAAGSVALSWFTARFGKARVFGVAALLLEAVRIASASPRDGAVLLLATGVLVAIVTLDWTRFLISQEKRSQLVVFEAAVEPNLLLFSSVIRFEPGQGVKVQRAGRSLQGHVVGSLAHKRAGRYQIVLNGDWRSLLPQAGTECVITILPDPDATVGFVVEGTNEVAVRFHPTADIHHGEALSIRGLGGPILYQVTSLKLERDRWDESAGLQARAVAAQVGELDRGSISLRPWLPKPFQSMTRTSDLKGKLPNGFTLIGHVAGTAVPIGVKTSWASNDGHVAILGMSGMGKTTAAQLLAGAFSAEIPFVAVDGTSEYRTKLGWEVVDPIDWDDGGPKVHEPRGQQAQACSQLIKQAMDAANHEFQIGEPTRRLLLLEEAHAFLPEWNFTTNNAEKEAVYKSARFILQARKFGLSFVMVSQRTAVISKSALSQCENFMMFRAIDETSLGFIEGVVGANFRDAVSGLRRYQAACVGPIFNAESPVIVDLLDPGNDMRSKD